MNLAKFATMDPIVLLSIVNMKLRDEFSTLDDLCRYFEIDRKTLSTTL